MENYKEIPDMQVPGNEAPEMEVPGNKAPEVETPGEEAPELGTVTPTPEKKISDYIIDTGYKPEMEDTEEDKKPTIH